MDFFMDLDIRVEFDDLRRVIEIAGSLAPLRPVVERSVARIQAFMQVYPPQRSGTKYRRSGTLGRRWTTQITTWNDEIIGEAGNNTSYGPFVQSDAFQAHWNDGIWQTDAQAIEENRSGIETDFQSTIQAILR